MEEIRSGTTTERVVRTGLLTTIVVVYSVWSLWDGYFAYPRNNLESFFRDVIGEEPPSPLPVICPLVTEIAIAGVEEGTLLEDLEARFGGGLRHGNATYILGPGGQLEASSQGRRVRGLKWHAGPRHSETDLFFQKLIGIALSPVALILLIHFIGVVRTRVVLNERGLSVGRKMPILWEEIVAVRAGNLPGVVEVEYERGKKSRSLRLDPYAYRHQPALVAAVCEQKGFELPP